LNNKPKESKDVAIKMLQLCDQNSKNSHKIKSIHLGWIYDQYDEKIEILLSQNKFQLLVKICIAYKEFLEKQNDINGNLYAIIRFYIGKCYAGLEKNKDAAKEFNEALKLLDPNDSCLNLNREDFFKRQIVYAGIKEDFGIMQMKMKKFDEAVGNFKEALTIYELQDTSKYVYLNFRLGFIALLQHDYTSGIDRIKTMIEKKKDDINFDKYPQIYHLLGILYSRVKNYDESIKWLEENIRVPQNLWDNDWQDPICQLGEIYRKSGKSEKAIELFREYNRKIYEQDKLEFNLNGCFGLSCSSLDEDGNDVLFNDECVPGINFLFEKAKEIPSEFENHKQLPPTTVQQLSNNQIYEMNSNNEYRRGICIIINNISFQAPNKWRDGSNMDALRLIDLFYKLKFKV
jgi:tetratricopeptide (TPR) repeat protein